MAEEDSPSAQPTLSPARPESEAARLKTLAEEQYTSHNLKEAIKLAKRAHELLPSLDGLSEMLSSFRILLTAEKPVFPAGPPDYYKILDVERFSHINSIKKQYKKLALTLHPDKNPSLASEEAFKMVGEAARVLSDRIRRKEYDMRLRIVMQSEIEAVRREGEGEGEGEEGKETFWTVCSTCRMVHKFEKRYLGCGLMCSGCGKSFKAVEVENVGEEGGGGTRVSARIKEKVAKGEKFGIFEKFGLGVKRKMCSIGEVLERSGAKVGRSGDGEGKAVKGSRAKGVEKGGSGGGGDDTEVIGSMRVSERGKRGKVREEESMTLAQMFAKKKKKKVGVEKVKGDKEKIKEKGEGEEEKEMEKGDEGREEEKEEEEEEEDEEIAIVNLIEKKYTRRGSKSKNLGTAKGTSSDMDRGRGSEKDDVEIVVVEEEKEKEMENVEKQKEEEPLYTREKRQRRRNSKYSDFVVADRDLPEKDRRRASEDDDVEIMLVEEEEEEEDETDTEYVEREKRQKEAEVLNTREKRQRRRVSKYGNFVDSSTEIPVYSEIERLKSLKKGNLEIMPVEDSDFHDFDKDRRERSFKKGQVWAVYDDDDGMPRHYALIDEVVSINPFEVTFSWLQFQSDGDEQLISWKEMGFHVSCGRFKVSRKVSVKYLNLFSHVVDCERAAREVYRVYPKKGSVWALYADKTLGDEDRNQMVKDKRCYRIVSALNSYSDIYGLSIAYLEKVDGFRTVFKRREIGANAVIWLGKDDLKLLSHQIPAKRLSGEEASGLPKDCWELDPASLTSQLLIGS